MSYQYSILAALFDLDGLIIDSEPLWDQAELDVFNSLKFNFSRPSRRKDIIGLRIDQVVRMWYETFPLEHPSQKEVIEQITKKAISLIYERCPLMPGVESALKLCKKQSLKIGLVSASPLQMLETILEMFDLGKYFDVLVSAEKLPYSKPHPQVYLNAAKKIGIDPLCCVALEDSLNGMIASKAARMRSIVIPNSKWRNDPRWSLSNVQLNNLTELTPFHLYGKDK